MKRKLDNEINDNQPKKNKSNDLFTYIYNNLVYYIYGYPTTLDINKIVGTTIKMNNNEFHIKEKIGKGTFGTVMKCESNNKLFAMKISSTKMIDIQDSQNEAIILKKISDYDQNITLNYIFADMYLDRHIIIMELGLYDLTTFINEKNNQRNNLLLKKFSKQLLIILQKFKDMNMIHSDLKPENIMITQDHNIRVIDFCNMFHSNESFKQGENMQTRLYRSPEILLGNKINNWYQIDMWSLGCILYELYTGKILFNGRSHIDQLGQIIKMCGNIPINMKDLSINYNIIQINNSLTIEKKINGKYSDIESDIDEYDNDETKITVELSTSNIYDELSKKVSQELDRNLLDLLSQMLRIDPNKRITINDALEHKYWD